MCSFHCMLHLQLVQLLPNFDGCVTGAREDKTPGYGDTSNGPNVSDEILDTNHPLQRPHTDTPVLGGTEYTSVSRHLNIDGDILP